MRARAARPILALLGVAVSVLAYGFWFGRTHASLWVSVRDLSDPRHDTPPGVVVSFRDASGRELARAGADVPPGAIYIQAPAEYACHDVELRAPFSAAARDEW